jgi:hypothetical protein
LVESAAHANILPHFHFDILYAHTVLKSIMGDLFGPSLTLEQLREIQARRSANDVIALLWEIKRLHVVLRRADQLAGIMRYASGGEGAVLNALKEELKCFPILEQWAAEREEMLKIERERYVDRLRRKTGMRQDPDSPASKPLGAWPDDLEG